MNKRKITFIGLFLLLTTQNAAGEFSWFNIKKKAMPYDARVRKFFSSYAASLLLSGGVGAFTGGLTRCIEKEIIRHLEKKYQGDILSLITLVLFYFSWHLEAEVRNDILLGVQGDFDVHQVGYKKNLMFRNARIASWITYVLLWDK